MDWIDKITIAIFVSLICGKVAQNTREIMDAKKRGIIKEKERKKRIENAKKEAAYCIRKISNEAKDDDERNEILEEFFGEINWNMLFI